jgi:pilus assembly protein FimV
VQNSTIEKWLIAALMLLTPWVVEAAGLGALSVQSSLGQPFQAEIDLMSVQREEFGSLSVRLASPDAYKQAGLQYNGAASGFTLRIEKRPNGQAFIKVTSARAINEFVVDLLIDLSWSSGRLMREYRVLLDPPGAEAPRVAAEPRPAPAAAVASAPRPVPVQAVERPAAASGSYGPIQRGETLSKIARDVRPEGVSVEQTLLGLYRNNPEAFIRNNMNLVRSGRILRVPDKEQLVAIPQEEAVKEFRAQVSDWNAYRQKIADAAAAAPEGRAATSGRITARVDEKGAAETKDVVRLSKGESPGTSTDSKDGKQAAAKDRIRTLEEDIVAREKALTEANERVAQLEKTIKDMQRLMEIKSAGLAAAQQKAEVAATPQPAATPPAVETTPPAAATTPPATPPAQPVEAKAPTTPAKSETPKPKPAVKAVSAPLPPEPSLLEMLFEPVYLGGVGVILLGGLGYWLMRRRRAESDGGARALLAPTFGIPGAPPGLVPAAATAGAATARATTAPAPAAPVADVDPLEEARIYVAHGRDGQAEAILKEALAKEPQREIIHLRLLEIYAARNNKAAFGRYAADFQKLTDGRGENWLKVAAMGFALDAANPLYAAGKDIVGQATPVEEAPSVDMDLDLDLTAAATEAAPDAGHGQAVEAKRAEPAMPDFNLEIPAAASADLPAAKRASPAEAPPLDFNIELPKIEVPGTAGQSGTAQAEHKADTGSAFKLADIDLNLDDKPQAASSGAGKDAHWYDVQAKFDLAKAYEEMSDKAGAREILQEVIREGDSDQQSQAKALLAGLG